MSSQETTREREREHNHHPKIQKSNCFQNWSRSTNPNLKKSLLIISVGVIVFFRFSGDLRIHLPIHDESLSLQLSPSSLASPVVVAALFRHGSLFLHLCSGGFQLLTVAANGAPFSCQP